MLKRYFKKLFYVLLLLQVSNRVEGQQLPQFSQYIFNGLHINPGYAGYKNEGYIQSTYRRQWLNFAGAPNTFTITGDFSLNEGSMGIGFSLLRDKIGFYDMNIGNLTYAYRINTGYSGRLSLGVSGGLAEYAIDPTGMVTGVDDDPFLPASRVTAFTPTMNTGLFYHDDWFYLGFSANNLIGKGFLQRQELQMNYHDIHYFFTGGTMFSMNDYVEFKPSFLIKHVSGSPTNYDLNAMFLYNDRFWIGGSFRSNFKLFPNELQQGLSNRNAFAFIVEYYLLEGMRIGYAYDHNLNVLGSGFRNTSHEVSLGVYLRSKRHYVYNPRWF
jgi:type IX secretion system PorP/SprF family membrane protein